MHRRRYGPDSWLLDGLDDPQAWAEGLVSADLNGVLEVVPAERTVLVRCDPRHAAAVGPDLDTIEPDPIGPRTAAVVIPMRFDGDDLADVADRSGLAADEVIVSFTAATYRVAFCGFSPGFAYLTGIPKQLQLPRRTSPRTRVPPGSVAIAAHYAAVYPSSSPGGWNLIGTTDVRVWDTNRTPPGLLVPGTTVRFESDAV